MATLDLHDRRGRSEGSEVLPQKNQRKNPSKRLRFEIFKRDNFTCQYCGSQPPQVVLVCDHIDPVVAGGKTTQENLITACEQCNQGKAGIPLNNTIIRPDADLMYLETQQEIAELKRYQLAQKQRDELLRAIAEDIQDRWCDLTGFDWSPTDEVILQMLHRYSAQIVNDAVLIVAKKMADGFWRSSSDDWIPYLWGVAKKISSQLEEGLTNA